MSDATFSEALARKLRKGATQIQAVTPGQNVYILTRDARLSRRPFLTTAATIIGETARGKVQVYQYAAGTQKRLVAREAVLTGESAWCRGEPIASICDARTYKRASVYANRREYCRLYALEYKGEAELTEAQVLDDYCTAPLLFQEIEPGSLPEKELRIVAHRGSTYAIQAQECLHRTWREQYAGGYLHCSSEGTIEEQVLEAQAREQHYVVTFLLRCTLHFLVQETTEVFFIDRTVAWLARSRKMRSYYLVHEGKIYAFNGHWQTKIHAYVQGSLPLEELLRYGAPLPG